MLKHRKDFIPYNLFDNQWHGDNQSRLNRRETVDNNLRARYAWQEMDMAAFIDAVQDFKSQTVHVRHRKHTYEMIARIHKRQMVCRIFRVAP